MRLQIADEAAADLPHDREPRAPARFPGFGRASDAHDDARRRRRPHDAVDGRAVDGQIIAAERIGEIVEHAEVRGPQRLAIPQAVVPGRPAGEQRADAIARGRRIETDWRLADAQRPQIPVGEHRRRHRELAPRRLRRERVERLEVVIVAEVVVGPPHEPLRVGGEQAIAHVGEAADAMRLATIFEARVARRPALGDIRGAVGRAVVDHQHLEVAERLAGEAGQAPVEQIGAVVDRHADRHRWHSRSSTLDLRVTRPPGAQARRKSAPCSAVKAASGRRHTVGALSSFTITC